MIRISATLNYERQLSALEYQELSAFEQQQLSYSELYVGFL
jgi:hypothetical protein